MRKIRIGFDHKYGQKIMAGIGVYVREVQKSLQALEEVELIPLYHSHAIHFMSTNEKNIFKKIFRNFWELLRVQVGIPIQCIFKKVDILFCPFQQLPLWKVCPQVLTVYDLAYLKFPEIENKWWFLRLVHPVSIRRADHIVAISESTKQDVMEIYKIDNSKISAIPLGIRSLEKISEPEAKKLVEKIGIKKNYILTVGTLSRRKNIEILIEAMHGWFQEEDVKVELVIVGAKGWKMGLLNATLEKFRESVSIHFTGMVNDRELAALYQCASIFVFPSLYEGFGFPILEAMVYGVPVIAARSSSLPEVGQDAVLYFDPHDAQELCYALQKIYHDSQLTHELIQKGYQNIKQFSWQKHADGLIQIFKQMVQNA